MITTYEKNFNILKNANDDLMLLIKAKSGEVESPELIYNKKDTAWLERTPEQLVVLTYIHPAIRNLLYKKKKVLVVEVSDGNVIREYMCPVKKGTLDEKYSN